MPLFFSTVTKLFNNSFALSTVSFILVIGGIFWVWLPWLGINEIPSNNTIIGGF